MRAESIRPVVALLVNVCANGFGIMMLLARDTKVNHIARHDIRHEDHQVVNPHECFTLGCNILNLYLFIYRQFFLLS